MITLRRDVFVPADVFVPVVVAGDGFTAEVGGVVPMSLELSRSADRSPADGRHIYDLVGSSVAVESSVWPDGWVLDVEGLYVYGPPGARIAARRARSDSRQRDG